MAAFLEVRWQGRRADNEERRTLEFKIGQKEAPEKLKLSVA